MNTLKKLAVLALAAATLAACAAQGSQAQNEVYGEIKGGVSVGHTHTR